jgi:hypothetical protein
MANPGQEQIFPQEEHRPKSPTMSLGALSTPMRVFQLVHPLLMLDNASMPPRVRHGDGCDSRDAMGLASARWRNAYACQIKLFINFLFLLM